MNKIQSLYNWLKKNEHHKEIKMLKQAFINDAHIVIDEFSDKIETKLLGKIKNKLYDFGYVVAFKIDRDIISSLNFNSYWHIHSRLRSPYQGLGYGSDLYMTAVKYVTELGGAVISAPISSSSRSDDAINLHQRLGNLPGIKSISVLIFTNSESDNIEIYPINAINKKYLSSLDVVEEFKRYTRRVDNSIYENVSGKKTNSRFSYLSIGNVIYSPNATSLPISIPVKMHQKENPEAIYKNPDEPLGKSEEQLKWEEELYKLDYYDPAREQWIEDNPPPDSDYQRMQMRNKLYQYYDAFNERSDQVEKLKPKK